MVARMHGQPDLPQWRRLRSQSTASSAILTTNAITFNDDQDEHRRQSLDFSSQQGPQEENAQYNTYPALEAARLDSLATIHEPASEFDFQGESVVDWAQKPQGMASGLSHLVSGSQNSPSEVEAKSHEYR